MSADIKSSIEGAVEYLKQHPDEARYTDSVARATLGDSLRVSVVGSVGDEITTDMPEAIGGLGDEPSPGWLYRAAVASCVASAVAMEAARSDVQLDSLVVEVDSESDDRGILGMDEEIPVGPISLHVRITVRAGEAGEEKVEEVVERGARRCPVLDATERAIETKLDVQVAAT